MTFYWTKKYPNESYYNTLIIMNFYDQFGRLPKEIERDDQGNIFAIDGHRKLPREETNSTFHVFEEFRRY